MLAVEDIVAPAVERHGRTHVMLCSFQKEESVILDARVRIDPGALEARRAFNERYEQSAARAGGELVELDEWRGNWKHNPLADWTEQDVWQRIRGRRLLYHALHARLRVDRLCPCTQRGDGREGRWAGTDKTERGLHV